jgi:hypothetical protein
MSSVNNLIIHQQLPASFGFTDYYDNGGVLDINGMEISADTRIQAGSLVLNLGGSVSKAAGEISELNFLDPTQTSIITSVHGAEMITSVGNPLNAFYGYQTNGIFSSASDAAALTGPKGLPMEAGDLKFVDLSGPAGAPDNVIDSYDKTIIGDPNPDLFGGVFGTITFKNFSINVLFNYSIGNDVFNYMKYLSESMSTYNNQSTAVLERWTAANTTSEFPRASVGDPTGNTVFSDRWIEDGSFFRLKQITVDYTLPALPGVYKGITLYVTGTNLLTFTKYSGYDPDFQYINDPFYMGVDYGKIPQTQSFIVGVKLDL